MGRPATGGARASRPPSATSTRAGRAAGARAGPVPSPLRAIAGRSARELGLDDPSGIVIDEIVGLLVTLTAAPVSWQAVALGFLLFRLFDILKPWPISVLDRRIHGGLGIMLDDVLAGLAASICLHLLLPYTARALAAS